MVRNLISRKLRPWAPTRACTKKTGPAVSSLTASAISAISGAKTSSATVATARLMARLAASSTRYFWKSGEKISWLGVSDSMATLPDSRSYTCTPSSATMPLRCASSS